MCKDKELFMNLPLKLAWYILIIKQCIDILPGFIYRVILFSLIERIEGFLAVHDPGFTSTFSF